MTSETRERVLVERLRAPDGTPGPDIAAVAELVNAVYAVAEDGLWRPGTTRTDADDVARSARDGEIRIARLDGRIVGCIRIARIDDTTAEFGMLATDPTVRGTGIGLLLVRSVETECAAAGFTTMQLEVIRPRDDTHESKQFLDSWYRRLGYHAQRPASLDERHPELVAATAVPCEVVPYLKALGSLGRPEAGARGG